MSHLLDYIMETMENNGLRQADIARACCIGASGVSMWKQSESGVPLENAVMIAATYPCFDIKLIIRFWCEDNKIPGETLLKQFKDINMLTNKNTYTVEEFEEYLEYLAYNHEYLSYEIDDYRTFYNIIAHMNSCDISFADLKSLWKVDTGQALFLLAHPSAINIYQVNVLSKTLYTTAEQLWVTGNDKFSLVRKEHENGVEYLVDWLLKSVEDAEATDSYVKPRNWDFEWPNIEQMILLLSYYTDYPTFYEILKDRLCFQKDLYYIQTNIKWLEGRLKDILPPDVYISYLKFKEYIDTKGFPYEGDEFESFDEILEYIHITRNYMNTYWDKIKEYRNLA